MAMGNPASMLQVIVIARRRIPIVECVRFGPGLLTKQLLEFFWGMGNAGDVSGIIQIAWPPGMFDPLDKLRLKSSVGRVRRWCLGARLGCLPRRSLLLFFWSWFPTCSIRLAWEETALCVEIIQPGNR